MQILVSSKNMLWLYGISLFPWQPIMRLLKNWVNVCQQQLINLGIKFNMAVKYVKVNPESSYVRTGQGIHSQCYIPSPKANGLLVSENFFKRVFTYTSAVAILVIRP